LLLHRSSGKVGSSSTYLPSWSPASLAKGHPALAFFIRHLLLELLALALTLASLPTPQGTISIAFLVVNVGAKNVLVAWLILTEDGSAFPNGRTRLGRALRLPALYPSLLQLFVFFPTLVLDGLLMLVEGERVASVGGALLVLDCLLHLKLSASLALSMHSTSFVIARVTSVSSVVQAIALALGDLTFASVLIASAASQGVGPGDTDLPPTLPVVAMFVGGFIHNFFASYGTLTTFGIETRDLALAGSAKARLSSVRLTVALRRRSPAWIMLDLIVMAVCLFLYAILLLISLPLWKGKLDDGTIVPANAIAWCVFMLGHWLLALLRRLGSLLGRSGTYTSTKTYAAAINSILTKVIANFRVDDRCQVKWKLGRRKTAVRG